MDCSSHSNKDATLTPEQFDQRVHYYSQLIDNQLNWIDFQAVQGKQRQHVRDVDAAAAEVTAEAAAKKHCSLETTGHLPDTEATAEPKKALAHDSPLKERPNEKCNENGSIRKYNLYLKSLEKSITFRNRGNELFNEKKYSDAIVLYNLAIINGPFDTVEGEKRESASVSLALANRSLCFGLLDHLESAIEDATAALQLGYPHVTKLTSRISSLQKRLQEKGGASSGQEKEVASTCSEVTRKREDDIVDTSAFSLFTDPESGRGLRATRDIAANTTILRETAYCAILDYDRFADFCYQCLIKLKSNHFFPCYTCTQVRFCSIGCANECTYHTHECHLIDVIKDNTNESNLAYRLSLRIILSEDAHDIIDALNLSEKRVEGDNVMEERSPLPGGYLGLLSLVDHQANQYPLTKVTAFLAAFALNRRSNFKQVFNTHQLVHTLASLFLKHARQVKWNAMSISYRSLMPSDFKVNVNILKEELIGVGIFHIQLLINHSCQPNIKTAKFHGRQVTLSTLQSISQGEEILNSYGMFSKWQGFNYRQEYLRNSYSFNCNCISCAAKVEPLIRAFRCFSCNGPILIENLDNLSQSTECSSCGRPVTSAELTDLKKGQIAGNQTIAAAVKFLSEYLNEFTEETDDSEDEDNNTFKTVKGQNGKKILTIEQLLHTGHRKLTQVLYKDHRDCIMTLDTIVAFYIRVKDATKLQSAILYANQLLHYTKRVFDEDVHLFNTYLKVIQVYSYAIRSARVWGDTVQSELMEGKKIRGVDCTIITMKSTILRLTSEAINLLHQIIQGDSETFSHFVKYFNECIK